PRTSPSPDEAEPGKPATRSTAKEGADDGGSDEGTKPWKRPKAFKFFRIALWPHVGYTSGTSQKNGIFDRDRTIENVMMGGTGPVGGGTEDTQFGGFAYGGTLDLEVFLFNVWLDFRKFFRPGGMLSVLVGYDHEFWLHRRVRLDPGIGFGFMRVFLGGPLEDLYYDPNSPLDTNIATAGIEVRGMLHLLVRIWRPLYFGVSGMGGYHYLFTANTDEVAKEKGFHFGGSVGFRVEFAFPRDPP
ncbi:MAG: hypothetical protein D6705_11490, partial [Deltaproteobacteria bacterium]